MPKESEARSTANGTKKKNKTFRTLRLRAKAQPGRGGSVQDPTTITEVLQTEETWNMLAETLAKLPDDEK